MEVNLGDKAQAQAVAGSGGKEQYQGAQCMAFGVSSGDKIVLCALHVIHIVA